MDPELLAARERALELVAALELARDDVRGRREAELLHLPGQRDDVVDRHTRRVRDVHARARRELRANRVELAGVVRGDLDRIVAQERGDVLLQLVVCHRALETRYCGYCLRDTTKLS